MAKQTQSVDPTMNPLASLDALVALQGKVAPKGKPRKAETDEQREKREAAERRFNENPAGLPDTLDPTVVATAVMLVGKSGTPLKRKVTAGGNDAYSFPGKATAIVPMMDAKGRWARVSIFATFNVEIVDKPA